MEQMARYGEIGERGEGGEREPEVVRIKKLGRSGDSNIGVERKEAEADEVNDKGPARRWRFLQQVSNVQGQGQSSHAGVPSTPRPRTQDPRAGDGNGALPNADKAAVVTHIVTKRSWKAKQC